MYFVTLAIHVVHQGCKSYSIIKATTVNIVAASAVMVCLSSTTGVAHTRTAPNTIANNDSFMLLKNSPESG